MESNGEKCAENVGSGPVKLGGIYSHPSRSIYVGFEPPKPVKLGGIGQVKPQNRIKIKILQDKDEVRYCSGEKLSEFPPSDKIPDKTREQVLRSLATKFNDAESEKLFRFMDQLKQEKNPYEFIMKVGYLLCMPKVARRELTVEQMNEGVFIIDTYTEKEKATINLGIARIQEVLEASDSKSALRKIEALLV